MKEVMRVILLTAWVAGMILAQGFWSTFFAVIVPLWSFVIVISTALTHFGIML
jgi:hypothetical protein